MEIVRQVKDRKVMQQNLFHMYMILKSKEFLSPSQKYCSFFIVFLSIFDGLQTISFDTIFPFSLFLMYVVLFCGNVDWGLLWGLRDLGGS